MATRSSLNQIVNLGVETTPGTSVPASVRLQTLSIEPNPQGEVRNFKPSGLKFNAISKLNKEWCEASVDGVLGYHEIMYVLASVCGAPVTTTPDVTDAPTLRQHVFTIDSTEDTVPQTYTVEHGSPVRADGFPQGIFTELGISISRDDVEVSSSMFGGKFEDNIVLTDNDDINFLPLDIVSGGDVTIYVDSTFAALGTTIVEPFSLDFTLDGRYGPVWVVNANRDSWKKPVETETGLTVEMSSEADSAGMSYLETLRDGDTIFMRIEAKGPQVGTDPLNRLLFRIDVALKVSDMFSFEENESVYAADFSFIGTHDAEWGKAIEITVRNEVTSL